MITFDGDVPSYLELPGIPSCTSLNHRFHRTLRLWRSPSENVCLISCSKQDGQPWHGDQHGRQKNGRPKGEPFQGCNHLIFAWNHLVFSSNPPFSAGFQQLVYPSFKFGHLMFHNLFHYVKWENMFLWFACQTPGKNLRNLKFDGSWGKMFGEKKKKQQP